MKFTPKIKGGSIACGVLTIAAMGLGGPVSNLRAAPMPRVVLQDTFGVPEQFQTNTVSITPAVDLISPADSQTATPSYIPVKHWYDSKHWWKRNAPIVGGAAGGGLIGGLAGGGKGLLIGGAVGAGGGALYKHYSHRHHHQGTENRYGKPYQPQR